MPWRRPRKIRPCLDPRLKNPAPGGFLVPSPMATGHERVLRGKSPPARVPTRGGLDPALPDPFHAVRPAMLGLNQHASTNTTARDATYCSYDTFAAVRIRYKSNQVVRPTLLGFLVTTSSEQQENPSNITLIIAAEAIVFRCFNECLFSSWPFCGALQSTELIP